MVPIVAAGLGATLAWLRESVGWVAQSWLSRRQTQQEFMLSTSTLLQETREHLVATHTRLETCLRELDQVQAQGWRMRDAITQIHATAVAARMRVHELEARDGLPLTQFDPLPAPFGG